MGSRDGDVGQVWSGAGIHVPLEIIFNDADIFFFQHHHEDKNLN